MKNDSEAERTRSLRIDVTILIHHNEFIENQTTGVLWMNCVCEDCTIISLGYLQLFLPFNISSVCQISSSDSGIDDKGTKTWYRSDKSQLKYVLLQVG